MSLHLTNTHMCFYCMPCQIQKLVLFGGATDCVLMAVPDPGGEPFTKGGLSSVERVRATDRFTDVS